MTDSPLVRLTAILDGIDQTETESDVGWWETSTGADFGAGKLHEVRALVVELTDAMRRAIGLVDVTTNPAIVSPVDAVRVLHEALGDETGGSNGTS